MRTNEGNAACVELSSPRERGRAVRGRHAGTNTVLLAESELEMSSRTIESSQAMWASTGIRARVWLCLSPDMFQSRALPRLIPSSPSTDHLPPLISLPPIPLSPAFSLCQPCPGYVRPVLRVRLRSRPSSPSSSGSTSSSSSVVVVRSSPSSLVFCHNSVSVRCRQVRAHHSVHPKSFRR